MYIEAAVIDAYVFVRRPSLSFIISLRRVNNLQVLRTWIGWLDALRFADTVQFRR